MCCKVTRLVLINTLLCWIRLVFVAHVLIKRDFSSIQPVHKLTENSSNTDELVLWVQYGSRRHTHPPGGQISVMILLKYYYPMLHINIIFWIPATKLLIFLANQLPSNSQCIILNITKREIRLIRTNTAKNILFRFNKSLKAMGKYDSTLVLFKVHELKLLNTYIWECSVVC